MSVEHICPNCGSIGLSIFYEVANVPVHSVLLMQTREEALSYATGEIKLGFCNTCGFISNVAFNPELHTYSSKYEATQSYSPTFNTFHHRLAESLVQRYDLYDKDIIEIGCGQGEFLILLCELGQNRGVGFDPAYSDYRLESAAKDRITFIKDFYSEKYAHFQGDFVCCKMTLEHIPDTAEFVSTVRRSIGNHSDTIVFFQVPSVSRILREYAFWDIYYEHCSYFSPWSLAYLFQKCGFEVLRVAEEYDDQYLMIEARPGDYRDDSFSGEPDGSDTVLQKEVATFSENYPHKLNQWRRIIEEYREREQKVVIWGSGSKGVAFLTTLQIKDEISCVVDINPRKHGTFMAGTGHRIVAPDFLRELRPDLVIVMNPVYRQEIQRDLNRMDLHPQLVTV
jgi:SAM-dependent methyltransferase